MQIDLMAGAAVIGGTIAAIKGFAGSGSGGVQGKLDAAGALAGSASVVMSLIPAIASSIPIVGSIVAAAMPLIGSLFPNGPAARANQIWKETTQAQYMAPTALNEQAGTGNQYRDFDAHGNLRTSNFSAVPQTTDPFLYWARGNNPVVSPGSVTSPYGAPIAPSAPAPNLTVHIHAMDAESFNDFAQRNSAAFGNAVAAHLQGGPTKLNQVIRYGN